jgi:hypothetical protein
MALGHSREAEAAGRNWCVVELLCRIAVYVQLFICDVTNVSEFGKWQGFVGVGLLTVPND